MSERLGWRFPSLDGSEREGINDPVIKAFSGDHEYYIARECIQNSIDHRLDNDKPVKVVFRLEDYPRTTFPGIDELTEVISSCLRSNSGAQAQNELTAMKNAISGATIRTLTVSDYNTKGLVGEDDDESGSWHRLVWAVGSNAPSGVGGGAYGLGKGAPFAASAIRTVFYSTYNDKGQNVFQGKTRLVSHPGKDGDMKRAVGYYGQKEARSCHSIRRKEDMPSKLVRNERGTDIIIPAYKPMSEDWQLGMVCSVLKNFWPAIHERMLEVEFYDGGVLKESINSENLAATLERYPGEQTGDAYYFYLAKTSPDQGGYFCEQIDGLGEVELYVKRGDGYPKRVQQMRAPLMVVSAEPYRSLLDPYAAVLVCKDKEGNSFLKELEPPQHDKWNPALANDVRTGKRIYKSLQDWVRNKLKSLSQAYEGERVEMPGLADYLTSMERDDRLPFGRMDKSDEQPDDETGAERIVPPSSSNAPAKRPLVYSYTATKADTGSDEGEGESQGGRGNSRGSSGGPNPTGRARAPGRSPIRVRNVGMTPSGDFTDVDLCLYSKQNFEGALKLIAAGEDMNTAIRVINAHTTDGVAYTIKGGRIMGVKIDPVRPTRITVRMDGRNIRYALGIESHENNT